MTNKTYCKLIIFKYKSKYKMQGKKYAHFQAGYNIEQRVKADDKYRNYAEYANK